MDHISLPHIEDLRSCSSRGSEKRQRINKARQTQPRANLQAFDNPLTSRLHRLGASLRMGVVSRLLSPLRGLREGERERGMLRSSDPLQLVVCGVQRTNGASVMC